ncbi:MAG: energy transducer TonB, partial [Mucilaginibacter sp.]
LCMDCIAQAIKLLKSSPKWSPGLIAGKPVRVRLALTVSLNHTAPSFTSNKPRSKNFIYTSVEKIPNYPGGREGFDAYVKSNIRYPALALANGTQGRVIVSFVVERNGKLTNITVERGIGDGCDEEAVRLVQKTSKKWTPGKMGDVKVRTAYSIPVNFAILESVN